MQVLFISKDGSSLGLAQRVKAEGHNSHLYILSDSEGRVGKDIVAKPLFNESIIKTNNHIIASAINQLLKECDPDLVVFDRVGMGRVADYIRSKGIAVVGGCRWADDAELDPTYAYKLMKQVGIPTSPKDEVSGIEVGCELWWNGLSSSIHNIVYKDKSFMNDGIGQSTECQGCVVKTIPPSSKIIKDGISKMERLLKKTNYRGAITLNILVTQSKLYGLSFNVRFTYDNLQSLLELYRGEVLKLLWSISRGNPLKGDFSSDYAISTRLSIPPYPNPLLSSMDIENVVIDGVGRGSEKHIWWGDVYKEDDVYRCAGITGNLLTVVARGRDIMECRKRVYRTITNLNIEDKQYRSDIGIRLIKYENMLRKWGWI